VSDFKTKMDQIRFPLGLRPRPRKGSLQRSPDPLGGFKGLLLRGGREGGGREGPTHKVREVKGGKGNKGEEGSPGYYGPPVSRGARIVTGQGYNKQYWISPKKH